MKMSANENESVDIRLYGRSDWIPFEEFNRMERPSRVFSSRQHLPMPPALSDLSNMEQNDPFQRIRDYTDYLDAYNTVTRHERTTVNGDTVRNRSPFVRFTITDPATQQITAAGQIPLNSSPPTNADPNNPTTNTEVADVPINEGNDDEHIDYRRHYFEQRRLTEHLTAMVQVEQQLRSSITGRRIRRFSDHPYFLRHNLDNNSTIGRIMSRRSTQLSAISRGYNDHPPDRSQTPEQELPEVLEQEMEPENHEYEEVYNGIDSLSTISSHDIDSDIEGDRRSAHFSASDNLNSTVDEENRDTFEVSNETPRTRVVPFIMSPMPLSPQAPAPVETVVANVNNNVSIASPFVEHDDDNPNRNFSDHESTVITPVCGVEEHPETYEGLNGQLTRLFECPVCFEHIVPPIFQCVVGHLVCNKCVLMLESCPTCRNPFNSKRNLYMEKVCYLVKFPCKNALTGCKQQMFIGQKEIHEQECDYRHYQCFFIQCGWKGYYPELHVHMINNHSNYILQGPDQSFDIPMSSNNQSYRWFLLAHNQYFAVIAHASIPRRVKIQVHFIGPATKAKQFNFAITITQQTLLGVTSQKLMYERSTLPYSELYELTNGHSFNKEIFCLPGDVIDPFIRKKHRRLPIILRINPTSPD